MMLKPLSIFLCLFSCILVAETVSVDSLKGKTIRICDDSAEWPPYTYYQRIDGKVSRKLVGFSVDVIREIFDQYEIKFELEIIPWKRCIKEVIEGQKYHMLLNATLNKERIQDLYITQPFYFTQQYYFWSKRKYPYGLDIKTSSLRDALYDLVHKYKMGNIRGYAMGLFETHGINIDNVDEGASDYPALLIKFKKGRFDVFAQSIEVLIGLELIGKAQILSDPDIGRASIPLATPTGFHIMISKRNKLGLALLRLIDPEISHMRATGRLDELLKKYIKDSRPIFN